jgi:hypothetical protein
MIFSCKLLILLFKFKQFFSISIFFSFIYSKFSWIFLYLISISFWSFSYTVFLLSTIWLFFFNLIYFSSNSLLIFFSSIFLSFNVLFVFCKFCYFLFNSSYFLSEVILKSFDILIFCWNVSTSLFYFLFKTLYSSLMVIKFFCVFSYNSLNLLFLS